jgi:hypothetical protein
MNGRKTGICVHGDRRVVHSGSHLAEAGHEANLAIAGGAHAVLFGAILVSTTTER